MVIELLKELTHHIGLSVRRSTADDSLVLRYVTSIASTNNRPSRFPAENTINNISPIGPPSRISSIISGSSIKVRNKIDVSNRRFPSFPIGIRERSNTESRNERVTVWALVVSCMTLVLVQEGDVVIWTLSGATSSGEIQAEEQMERLGCGIVEHVAQSISSVGLGWIANVESESIEANGDSIVNIGVSVILGDGANLR